MLNNEQAFYFVDGIPTKGVWIDLELIRDEDEIKDELMKAGHILPDANEEPDYDGDLLVADIEGDIVHHFYDSQLCSFDLKGFTEVAEYLELSCNKHLDPEAVAAYLDYASWWSQSDFEEAYCGAYDSEETFAEQFLKETSEIPDHLESYIDYEKYARDLFINDFYFNDGYVFRRN